MIHVAGYCRVSTDKDDQANSFESQQRYFREYIEKQPDWCLHEIYADEGITGTSTRRRLQFNRMIHDAHQGKFQLILTKEVSRFSRNILDTITYTRMLRQIGVGVCFMTDGIDTRKNDAELYLSIMASLAQEESRKTSSRVIWGQTRQMERGVVFGPSLLGYAVQDGTLRIVPQEAALVRMIYEKYAREGLSAVAIAEFLTDMGYTAPGRKGPWRAGTVLRILRNEKYAGDLVQRKTCTPDYLTHKKQKNTGQAPIVRIDNHHMAIIDRELWNLAQQRRIKNNRHAGASGYSNRYAFSGKIRCGQCGASFVGRSKTLQDGTKVRRWSCGTVAAKGRAHCSIGKLIRDDDAMQMFQTALMHLSFDKAALIHHVTDLVNELTDSEDAKGTPAIRHRAELERVQEKLARLTDSYCSGDITRKRFVLMQEKYESQLEDLQRWIETMEPSAQSELTSLQDVLLPILNGQESSDGFCKTLLDSLTVFPDRHMELKLHELPHRFHFAE